MIDQILGVYTNTLDSWEKNHLQDPAAESLAFSNYLKGISDKVYQTIAESNLAHAELDFIEGGLLGIFQRVKRISFVRNLFVLLLIPIRFWRARKKKELIKNFDTVQKS